MAYRFWLVNDWMIFIKQVIMSYLTRLSFFALLKSNITDHGRVYFVLWQSGPDSLYLVLMPGIAMDIELSYHLDNL